MINDSSAYDSVIADLKSKRRQITGVIDCLEHIRDGSEGPQGSTATSAAPAVDNKSSPDIEEQARPGAFVGMSIGNAIKAYLVTGNKPVPIGVLADGLLAGGVTTKAKDFIMNVRTTISHDPRFRMQDGQVGLVEWHPDQPRNSVHRNRRSAEVPSATAPQTSERQENG